MENRDLITSSYDEPLPDSKIKGVQLEGIEEEKFFETEESFFTYDSLLRNSEPRIAPVENSDRPTFMNESLSLIELKKVTSYQVIKLNRRKRGILPLEHSNQNGIFKSEILKDWFTTVKCKILILVEINHKNFEDFYSTFESIKENIPNIVKQSQHRSIDSFIEFNEIGVVFILDGIESFNKFLKLNKNSLNQDPNLSKNSIYFKNLFSLGLIKDMYGIDPLIKNRDNKFIIEERMKQNKLIQDTDEIAHMFSRRIVVNDSFFMNSIFCLKQHKRGKLNTHRWFLEGLCTMLKPKYVALLEVGVIPAPTALHLLFDAMERDESIAGCFGEVIPITKKSYNPIVYSQFFEYKFIHIFDKGFHSLNGFLFVNWPGGLNAYRWDVLKEPVILNSYFLSERLGAAMNIYSTDVYLDRSVCLHYYIMRKPNKIFFLRYIEGSKAKISVPNTLTKLILQRQSWAKAFSPRENLHILDLNYPILRRLVFFNTFLNYLLSDFFFNYFIVSSFFLAYLYPMNLTMIDIIYSKKKNSIVQLTVYIFIIFFFILLSCFVKPKRAEFLYRYFGIIFNLLALITISRILISKYIPNFDFLDNLLMFLVSLVVIAGMISGLILSSFCFTCLIMLIWIPGIFIYITFYETLDIINLFSIAISYLVLMVSIVFLLNARKNILKVIYGFVCYTLMIGVFFNMISIYSCCNIVEKLSVKKSHVLTNIQRAGVNEQRISKILIWLGLNYFFSLIYLGMFNENRPLGFLMVTIYFSCILLMQKLIGGILYLLNNRCCKYSHRY